MAIASTTSLVDAIRQYRQLEPVQLEEVTRTLQASFADPKALAKELIQRGWLTPHQANHLLQGKGQDLVLGSYILLEKLGEGGMGQVFKGRNWKLGRIVALKIIRKERLANPDAVRRFEREVRSAAALSHPNIVRAYDADEIAGTHLLVMEYVEGAIDLAKLVKQNGPLPVAQACEYIRQAALGLQHAYERGMVHRDIKPANLLLTGEGKVVKLLDMGLARLHHPGDGDDDKGSTMTQEGSVLGTPDYIAPEQALDTHTVDIRADLYSLGCAFYYLLTGRVPFPGGTLLQKLNKHQNEDPLPVEKLRPEVSPGVAGVLRKLMAKKPVDRYQTPAELATVLAALGNPASGPVAGAKDQTFAEGGQSEAGRDTLVSAFSYMEKRDDTVAVEPLQPLQGKAASRRWWLVGGVGGLLALVGLAVILMAVFKGASEKKLPAKGDPPLVAIPPPKKTLPNVDDAWLKQVNDMPAEQQAEAVAAKLKERNPGFDGKVTSRIENGEVIGVEFVTDHVTDISPLRALTKLYQLECAGKAAGEGKLADLAPLKSLPLRSLYCNHNALADLAPLKGMPLEYLYLAGCPNISDLTPLKDMALISLVCDGTRVSDLTALKGMPLQLLSIPNSPVSDLAPLKGMHLNHLRCDLTTVADLTPLKGMNLTHLECNGTKVTDLSPLKGMPLKEIWCDFKAPRDTEILRSIKTLEKINDKPAAEFWKEVEVQRTAFTTWLKSVADLLPENQIEAVVAKLKERNPGFDGKVTPTVNKGAVFGLDFRSDEVTDIAPVRALPNLVALDVGGSTIGSTGKGMAKLSDLSPLKGMPLVNLNCSRSQVADLSPLKGMSLVNLGCGYTLVKDISPLKGMPLTYLVISGTQVTDLASLKGMPLKTLHLGLTPVSDLSPLKGITLTTLSFNGTNVKDLSPLKEMPLKELECDFKAERDAEILRSIKTLEKINNKPAAEFWKEVDGAKGRKP